MDTVEITLSIPELEHDRIIGWLDERATGFVQTDATLTAYVPVDHWSAAARERLADRLRADGYDDALSLRILADRNWNAEWEQSVPAVRVGPFLLCGSATEVPSEHADATVLRIDPKQSFGTGHHATTRLCLRLLADTVAPGDTVVDVGTGTGVLAIAACRLGAQDALAVDTDPAAVANARENAAANAVADCITVRDGSVEAVPADVQADVLVVNLTLDPLLDLLPALHARRAQGGDVILSGLLTGQRGRVQTALSEHNLHVEAEETEDGWWGVRCR